MRTQHSGKELQIDRAGEKEDMPEESLLWAISYADLLMVMLAFFVIFFEFTQVTDDRPMERLASDLKKRPVSR